ncbi:MAG TPA: hypothetical protein VN660_14510 [Steroidobacteraceae bacterium]|nr:hypothetical protein [Steroidobacteraceae bacterium]
MDVTGTSAQASPNMGYLADNSAQITITLPTSPLVGDLVGVSGIGTGGWKIAQNAGQQIYVGFENAPWAPVAPVEQWILLAASNDRTHLIAGALNGTFGGPLYTSTDGGATWSAQSVANNLWSGLAISDDGTHILAAAYGTQLYVSSNSGSTWAATGPSIGWSSVSTSPDGATMVAFGNDSNTSQNELYLSVDGGTNWTLEGSGSISSFSLAALVWPTPTELLAVGTISTGSGILTSSDAGAHWTVAYPGLGWQQIATSSDGSQIYVVGGNSGRAVSRDSGTTWSLNSSDLGWSNLAVSPDGTTVMAGGGGLPVSVSTDAGENWTQMPYIGQSFVGFVVPNKNQKIIGALYDGPIEVASASTTVGTAGVLSGNQNESATLQYFGNGVFSLIANEGQLTVH